MKAINLFFVVIATRLVHVPLSKGTGIVYYVRPTEQIGSCNESSQCPSGQVCQTMDYFAENSRKFFSPDCVNVTLIFMCGIHNFTKNLIIQNLHSFVMKGETGIKENVIIDMLYHSDVKLQLNTLSNKLNCTNIIFLNVSYVNITTVKMICPSICLEGGLISIIDSNVKGSNSIKEVLSTINITGRASQGFVDNCTFKENCFVVSNTSDGITINNSTFQLYKHESSSIIIAYSSAVTLSGNVNFTDSVTGIHRPGYSSGTAVFLNNSHSGLKYSLNIMASANVYCINLTSSNEGGAIYVDNGVMNIGIKSNVVFEHNSVSALGGAVALHYTVLKVYADASMTFYNNTALFGGPVYIRFSEMDVYYNGAVHFSMNSAQNQGGAMYIIAGSCTEDLNSISVNITSAQLSFYGNHAFQGGAVYILPSYASTTIGLELKSSIEFVNNTATDAGGAVYSEMQSSTPCLFVLTDYLPQISFIGNFAKKHIGHHMYGTSIGSAYCGIRPGISYCSTEHINITLDPDLNETLSPVSSAPFRVCLCDMYGQPQCANVSEIFPNVTVYRGESFMLSALAVGYDFGATVGTVYAQFFSELSVNKHPKLAPSQYRQIMNNTENCSTLSYAVYTQNTYEQLLISTSDRPLQKFDKNQQLQRIKDDIDYYDNKFGCLEGSLLTTPVTINVTLLPGCPPGFVLGTNPPGCGCYSVLTNDSFHCFIRNKTSFFAWNTTTWVNATFNGTQSSGIIYNPFCPLQYCKLGNKVINIRDDPSEQCASNRTGILCGACKKNFSLAIGSSQCIECHSNKNLVLMLFFAAGGVFLVFFILVLNLTVTQGLINGLIFYANIVWGYKIILFPPKSQESSVFVFLQAFIAWLNLDFGIETCFFVGLDVYWKTWLQFLFAFYIWAIAGGIIVACRYSSRLTNLIGSRPVPLLATLFLLSFMKLLRTIIDAVSVAMIVQYPQQTSYAVWYLDGNLLYCQHPHAYLFIAAIAVLLFLWLPYTFLLLFIQPLRKVSHLKPLTWINKLTPVYDAYFHPLEDKHHYWFGLLLLIRGILVVVLTVTSTTSPELNSFVLMSKQLVPSRRENSKLRELLRAIKSYDRLTSLRPASTYDRSAPVLKPHTFSSSQSLASSTSASPPDHTHFNSSGILTQSMVTAEPDNTHPQASESTHEPPSHLLSDGDVFQHPSSDTRGLQDPGSEIPEQQDSEGGLQELQTIDRRTIASLTGSNVAEYKNGSESDSDQESSHSSQQQLSHLVRRSSLDKDSDFEVLAASASGEDWQLL